MDENNFYPVFEADQVLSADHLNEIVNYLDEQDRLTRNKLIGIGIVCGLELRVSSKEIEISKGCGVTSEGYLIVQDELVCSHYRQYELPSDFYAKYKTVYEPWNMYELLTAERSLEFEDTELLANNSDFLKNKIVVLLLEMKEIPLKNCIETDCDDKGSKIEFSVKPLLVKRSDIDNFLKIVSNDNDETDAEDNEVLPALQDIRLKRFNVEVKSLKTADDVFNSFLRLLGDRKLNKLAEILNQCYEQYKPLLTEETENPFSDVIDIFENTLESIKETNPYFIQYFYDWIDDIIKAYNEFKDKVHFVQILCCPDEGLFPLHLMLGRATRDTGVLDKSKYRNYFIYSPLFNHQKDLLSEIQILFRRLKKLIQNYKVRDRDDYAEKEIKITPSKYLDKKLSERCIPYYYDPSGLYQCWSWSKTRRGKSKFNLSYNSNKYSNADSVINPLMYDIEWFNFFRIEGHIGKDFSAALKNILNQRNIFNLPFEVVALSTATISKFSSTKDDECNFKDLESLYNVLKSELICKIADATCFVSGIKSNVTGSTILSAEIGREVTETIESGIDVPSEEFLNKNISFVTALSLNKTLRQSYLKGDFIRRNCKISKGTIGEKYLSAIKKGNSFTKPDSDESFGTNKNNIYAHLFYFVDCVENLMASILPLTLDEFYLNTFKSRYELLMGEIKILVANEAVLTRVLKTNFNSFINPLRVLLYSCIDDRLETLKNEFIKRQQEIASLRNLNNYFQKHPGMEHKAGVPKGGTFILVYHETQRKKLTLDLQKGVASLFKDIPGISFEKINIAERVLDIDFLKDAEVKDKVLTFQFYDALSKYMDSCKDMNEDTKEEITGILVNRPEAVPEEKFRVTDFSVIADFYLPYLCCSDCASIAYVMPKETVDVLKINIEKTDFCNDDENSYSITVSPTGGSLTASGGGLVSELGRFFFKPLGVTPGINNLAYKLSDGRMTSIDIKISKSINIDFKIIVENDGVTVKFIPDEDNYPNYEWNFGDGSAASNEKSPVHKYSFDGKEKTFNVTLSVDNAPCISVKTIPILLEKPEEIQFSIEPKLFCSNDIREYEFTISPPAKAADIEKDGLKIKKNPDTKNLFFVPKNQELTKSKDYRLIYKEVNLDLSLIVADAGFTMRIKRDEQESFILTLKAKQADANKYEWVVKNRTVSLASNDNPFIISYKQHDISPGITLNISLTIFYELNDVVCSDKKTFKLTKAIFEKYLGEAEFDNDTVE